MSLVRTLLRLCTAGWQWLIAVPKLYSIPALVIPLLFGVYILRFVLATPVAFAYSGHNCVSQLTFAPQIQRPLDTSPFAVTFHRQLNLLGTPLVSFQTCIALQQVANPGSHQAQVSPFGNWLALTTYTVKVPDPPAVSATTIAKTIPLTKPLELQLSASDETFTYSLQANRQQTNCTVIAIIIRCELDSLLLEQGKEYDISLVRYFKQSSVGTVVNKKIEILHPAAIIESSIKPNEIVVAKPTEILLKFDKPIKTAKAEMVKLDADKSEPIETKLQIKDAQITLTFAELPRRTQFEIRVSEVEANDGSSLPETYILPFQTSGGPKVSGISIPKAGVALGATAVIRFDQELFTDQDVAAQVKLEGGAATISRKDNSVEVILTGIGKCTGFTITVTKDIKSKYGISGDSAWSYSSRTICHTIETIGYSVKGRPINANIFGNGSINILYIGATHGNEVSSSYLMQAWITELEANASSIPANKKIIVISEVNPDGVASRTRNNANNVDLNRNYDMSNWRADVTDTRGNLIKNGGGASPMSEPEVKALAAYTIKLSPRLTLSYHSQGNMVMGNGAGESAALSKIYSRLSGYRDVSGNVSGSFSYEITGTHEDWMAEKLGLPNLVIELSSSTNAEYSRNKAALWEMARY